MTHQPNITGKSLRAKKIGHKFEVNESNPNDDKITASDVDDGKRRQYCTMKHLTKSHPI